MSQPFSPEQLRDPNFHPYMDPQKGGTLRALCICWCVFTGTSLILRIWSRCVSPVVVRIQSDDLMALAAWPCVAALNVLIYFLTMRGMGNHIDEVPIANMTYILKGYFVGNILYPVGMTFARISAVLSYRRIFTMTNPKFRIAIWFTLIMAVVWGIIIVFISVFECLPVEATWDTTIPKHCGLSPHDIILSSAATSVVVDLWVLVLPLPMIYVLHMSWAKRVLLLAIFISAYFIVVASVGRLVAIVQAGSSLDTDFTYALVTPIYWIVTEISLAATCINLPSIFHLVRRGLDHGVGALFNARLYPIRSTHPSARPPGENSSRRTWHSHQQMKFTQLDYEASATVESASAPDGQHVPLDDLEEGVIRKTYDVSVTTQHRDSKSDT